MLKCIKNYLILSVGLFKRLAIEHTGSIADPSLLEQSFGFGGGGQGSDETGAGPAAQQGHLVRVSAKVLDVELDPLEGGDDVAHAVVSGRLRVSPLRQGISRQEAQNSSPIVHRDEHDALILSKF